MPRGVEYEVRPGVWYRSSLCGPHGLKVAQAAGYPARYIGGVLQVNAKVNNRSDAGGVETPGFQEMTPEEYEAAYDYMDARLVPYATKAVETGRIQYVPVEGRIVGEETPAWKQARDLSLAPGECPCGILRAMCDYHR